MITSSGAIATLLLGLVTLIRGTARDSAHIGLGGITKWALILAVCLFGGAAILGLIANLPLGYREASLAKLRDRTKPEEWSNRDPIEAARYEAVLNIQILTSARKKNGLKVFVLVVAIGAEALAAAAVAVAVAAELWRLAG